MASTCTTSHEGMLRTISLAFGPSGGVFTFTIDLNDENSVVNALNEIVRLATAPLVAHVVALTKELESLREKVRNENMQPSNQRRGDGDSSSNLTEGFSRQ